MFQNILLAIPKRWLGFPQAPRPGRFRARSNTPFGVAFRLPLVACSRTSVQKKADRNGQLSHLGECSSRGQSLHLTDAKISSMRSSGFIKITMSGGQQAAGCWHICPLKIYPLPRLRLIPLLSDTRAGSHFVCKRPVPYQDLAESYTTHQTVPGGFDTRRQTLRFRPRPSTDTGARQLTQLKQ